MKKITVIGSLNTDMVVNVQRMPQPGETILGGRFLMNDGGKGANQAVAAARLGGNVALVTKIGDDIFGRQAIENYTREGIDTAYISQDRNLPSGVALILVDDKGENSIAVASGANMALTPADIENAAQTISDSEIVLMQLEIPMETVEFAASLAHSQGKKVILNPAPATALSPGLLSHLYMLIPNQTEAELLTGIKITDMDSARQAADMIAAQGVEVVVITMGSEGAFIREDGIYTEVPAVKVQPVDTTAAGDTFCGALCVALCEGHSVTEAVRFANRCSAVSVTRQGAQLSIPYRNEITDNN